MVRNLLLVCLLLFLVSSSEACACNTKKCSRVECTICYAAIVSCSSGGCGTDVVCIGRCLKSAGLEQCTACVLC